jgi:hypothetical protein
VQNLVDGLVELRLVGAAREHRVEDGLHRGCERMEIGGSLSGHAEGAFWWGMVLQAIVSREAVPDPAEISL